MSQVKRYNHFITWFCNYCGYFRDLSQSGLAKLDNNVTVRSLGRNVICQRCKHVGGSVHLKHVPSSNPYPGKVFYSRIPWKMENLAAFEPGTVSYRQQEALLRKHGKL